MARSEKLGNWQCELDALLKTSKGRGHLSVFESATTDADRIKFLCDKKLLIHVEWLRRYFTDLSQTFHAKDRDRALEHKQAGTRQFLARCDKQACLLYTLSMQYASSEACQTESGSDLGLAYGNRSAVLFRLHKYEECITDIDRAEKAGYPAQSQHKLLMRRCLCYAKLGQKEEAQKALQKVKILMKHSGKKIAEHLQGEIKKAESEIKAMKEEPTEAQTLPCTQGLDVPRVSYGTNNILVQASSAVEMKTSPTQGRYLQATQDIMAGDTLIVERPFAAVLLPPHYSTHCLHCFAVLPYNPVGCKQCSGVLYCDEVCRDASWKTYHYVECPYMDLLHSVGIAHLALRIVLTAGLSYLTDFLQKRSERDERAWDRPAGVTEEGRYERNYLTVYDLMTHVTDMPTDDLFQYSLTASVLLGVLIHSGWFHSAIDDVVDLSERNTVLSAFLQGDFFVNCTSQFNLDRTQVLTVGGVLLRHIQQLVCNAHAITALHATQVSEDHLVETQSQVRVATAIYPTASLMNHSCDPIIISSFQKDVLIVKSVKNVKTGGEIFNCYGPHCKRMKQQERQKELKSQYFFDCCCDACVNDQDGVVEQGVKCQDCGKTLPIRHQKQLTCPVCHVTVDIAVVMSQLESADLIFAEGVKLLENQDYDGSLREFKTCLKKRTRLLSANHHDLGQVHDAIAQCLASTGRYKDAADHLAQSVVVTESVFGPDSVEMGRELHKMAEVLIHAERPQDALKTAARALGIAQKLYNESDEWVQELLCLNTALTKILADCRF